MRKGINTKGLLPYLRDNTQEPIKTEYTLTDFEDIKKLFERQGVNETPVDMEMISWVAEHGEEGVFYNLGKFAGGKQFCINFLEEMDKSGRELLK